MTEGDWFFYRIPAGIFKHSDEELFELMADVIHKTGNDGKAGIQIDVAADCYYDRNHKRYRGLFSKEERDRDQLLAYYLKLIDTYPFVSIEDAFYEDDYESHAILRENLVFKLWAMICIRLCVSGFLKAWKREQQM